MSATLEQQFETVYREHAQKITAYIGRHLYRPDRQLAEDLAAETFLRFWRTMLKGTVRVENARGLLNTIADRAVADHFRRRCSFETATDFGATNLTEVPGGASFSPYLAGLLADLEDAKDRLSAAADAYRAATQENSTASLILASAQRPDTVARAEARKAAAVAARAQALEAFAAAGQAVAAARAAWNEGADGLAVASYEVAGVVTSR